MSARLKLKKLKKEIELIRSHCLMCENKLGTVVKPGWWDKWRKRWLELADKFKEAK